MILLILNKIALIAPTWAGPLLAIASGSEGEAGPPRLPSLVELVFGPDSVAEHWVNVIYAFAVGVFLSIVCMRVYAKRQMIPGKL